MQTVDYVLWKVFVGNELMKRGKFDHKWMDANHKRLSIWYDAGESIQGAADMAEAMNPEGKFAFPDVHSPVLNYRG